MHQLSQRLAAILFILIFVLTGCSTESTEVLGEAYVAPATLSLRRELTQKNSSVALLKHGEKVKILDVRRRFVKVRAESGALGWVDSLQLLSPEQMEQIRRDHEHALTLPSEGSAGVFEALNIHLDPSRQSPAFARISDGGSVQTLAHRMEPKTSAPPRAPALTYERQQVAARRQRKEKQVKSYSRLPPKPAPPKPPANWQELSSERIDGAQSTADIKANKEKVSAAAKIEQAKKPVILEDWTLVRTKDKQCGWVLSRNLVMSIPDEVAQYAEGKHITSYFDLGSVKDDEKGVKHNWLWTTSAGARTYDFDAWRIFIWNKRRHRFETSYRQREVEGYFPVNVDAVEGSGPERSFELIMKDDDSKFRKRELFVRRVAGSSDAHGRVQLGCVGCG